MAELIKSTFSDWTLDSLETTFGMERVYQHNVLQTWLEVAQKIVINDGHQNILKTCKRNAQWGIDQWNEEEIKQEIIHPILSAIQFIIFDTKKSKVVAKAFAERQLKGVIASHELGGRPDGLIAKGSIRPKTPYFCLHEYKKQHDSSDGLGQLLAAMLVAQKLNTKQRPIYGAYVIGAYWYFVVLDKKEYSISSSYDVTKDDIFDIYRTLQQLKLYVIQFLEEDKDLP